MGPQESNRMIFNEGITMNGFEIMAALLSGRNLISQTCCEAGCTA
jgi:hypothetical protein